MNHHSLGILLENLCYEPICIRKNILIIILVHLRLWKHCNDTYEYPSKLLIQNSNLHIESRFPKFIYYSMTMVNQFIVTKIISLTLTYYNLTTNWRENQKGSSRGSQCTQFSSYQTKGSKDTFDEGQKFDLDLSIPNMKING